MADQRPVIRTVCKISTIPRHPRGGKTRSQLEAEIAILRGQLRRRTGWASGIDD